MADRVGQQFGAYQLTSLLAESSVAEVYRGEQRYSHIDVAIKLLRRPLAITEEIDSFRAEARALASLIHPHIARTLGFDVQEQIGYLVMDYAPGGTLRQRYSSGERLELETILPLCRQIADALHYTHEQGIIHQALKPENLLVGHQEEVLLAGFYLASAHQLADSQTPIAVNDVTAYLAPEQLQGKPGPASDQYALGIMVYEWLSGSLPFQGAGAELAQQIFKAAPLPLHGNAFTVWSPVERVVMRALMKDPTKRFASVEAFAAALEEAAHAEPTPQPAAASASASGVSSKQPTPAARSTAAQPARSQARTAQPGPTPPPAERFGSPSPQAWQNQPQPARAPAPQQPAWQRQSTSYQAPPQPPAWQRPKPTSQASNMNTVGCVIGLIVVALIGLIVVLSGH